MEKLIVCEGVKQTDGKFVLTFKGEALFHDFSVDFEELENEELENEPANCSTEIIEGTDGSVGNSPVDHTRSLEPDS
jgi:hypothetical protein